MKEIKKLESWDWFHNPFLGTKELNGLRVMMAILNNWDCKTINNSIYEVDGERRYVVSDLDATFGKTGHEFSRSVGVVKDYAGSKFIEKLTPDAVDFALHSRPFFVMIFDVHYYTARTRMEKIAKHIPRADAKWLGERLAQLSEEQIHDCFRAAGYTPEEVEGFTRAVQKRIADLNAL